MDVGFRSPLIDFFRRGEVARDVRLLAAQGALAPRAQEQLALLLILSGDPDPLVARTAAATLDLLPAPSVARFLARRDVPQGMRDFFAARGILPDPAGAADDDQPLVEAATNAPEEQSADPQILSSLPVVERMKLAMRGSREQRGQLIRDSNKLVAAAVLSSPKVTESEVEGYARMANLSEDVLRIIAMNRAWVKNYHVVAALARNPKTPPALAMGFVQRLNERDLKTLSVDRNVAEAVRLAARKFLVKGK
ncbi:MAG TPA: hypothetical protein VM364_00215 [Vicinamibacterales bacterium]|nr:hypothetical protein [Vicinamibacterales bacterium]